MSVKKVVVISDIHAGSVYGLLPPNFVSMEGNTIHQNAIQQWLWQNWMAWQGEWWDTNIGDGSDVLLIVNGDSTEGVHHGTKEIISPDPTDHRMAAFHILQPLAERCEHVIIIEGTECHTNNMEHTLAHDLAAIKPNGKNKSAFGVLHLEVHGTRCFFAHHISATARVYLEASALSIALRNVQLEAISVGQKPPRVCGFAHRHRMGYYRAHDALSFVTPPWQAVTRFGRKVVPAARCVPGVVLLDWTGKERDSVPEFHSLTFNPPPDEVVEL